MKGRVAFGIPCLILLVAGFAGPEDSLILLPGDFTLSGPASRQTLLVQEVRDGQILGQITEGVVFASDDPGVVKVEAGTAVPVGNGRATLTARAGSRTAATRVTVVGMDKPFEPSFRNDVQPLLMRFGCSSGACHGAAAGKNGFKLSLRGYDNEGDHRTITRHASGRRIVPEDPARSLLLLKPTGVVPHKGGLRFETGSREYQVLAEWIAAGTPEPGKDDPRIERLEVLPGRVVLRAGAEQQLIVRAHFSDGSVRDATSWAKYAGTDSSVAVPDEKGRVKVMGPGEGAITAWYLSKIAVATVSVPYPNSIPPAAFSEAGRRNFIDDLVLEKLKSLNLPPSPPAGDAEFLRRATLDAVGLLPTADEARAFLADRSADKRDRWIDALLNRPEFVDYWTYKWSDLLLVSSKKFKKETMWAYHSWIRKQVAANTPWDQLVRQLVTATGSVFDNGAACFYLLNDEPARMSETISQAFLGMSIQCAKCHNHPMEKWTNDQYYGMANLFARVRSKSGSRSGDRVIFSVSEGDLIQPLTGKPQPPRPLDGEALPLEAREDRREPLARWLVGRDNPYFSRSIVNRVWANFMGVGLVESVDDMRKTNPASNEKLLGAMADFLADQRFDLKALMRLILQSHAYQRSSKPRPGNAADRRFYSRYYPRRLTAEVALDALSQVTEVPTSFDTNDKDQKIKIEYPRGWRALQLPDSNVESYFLKSFGRAERAITCECERTLEPSMAQALHLANGETLNSKLQAPHNRLERFLSTPVSDDAIIEEAYLATLSRFPGEAERKSLLEVLAGADKANRREAIEDLYWGILSSREFLFNH